MTVIRITPNFVANEFMPDELKESPLKAPLSVLQNIDSLVKLILQPARDAIKVSFHINSGYRPEEKNVSVGGVPGSDHLRGAACDFYASEDPLEHVLSADYTFAAFHWIMEHCDGKFGQLILEDHRLHYNNPAKLWVHVALTSPKHGGGAKDPNRLLVSTAPKSYEPWTEGRFA